MKNIALIGAGQLGSRHLQSLKSIILPSVVWVVDNSSQSLEVAKERYDSLPENPNIVGVEFITNMDKLPEVLDLVVIATNSSVRQQIIKEITTKHNVLNIVLEKVLFQAVEHYDEIGELITSKQINVWVNCPRRLYPVYRTLKDFIENQKVEQILVKGKNIGLGCNSIHYIDIVSWLINDSSYVISSDMLSNTIIDSKRIGYKEFTGELNLKFASGTRMSIEDAEQNNGSVIEIITTKNRIVVDESQKTLTVYDLISNEVTMQERFEIPFQSQLTAIVAEDIFINSTCGLTPYDESTRLHLPFITELINFCNKNGYITTICPIT